MPRDEKKRTADLVSSLSLLSKYGCDSGLLASAVLKVADKRGGRARNPMATSTPADAGFPRYKRTSSSKVRATHARRLVLNMPRPRYGPAMQSDCTYRSLKRPSRRALEGQSRTVGICFHACSDSEYGCMFGPSGREHQGLEECGLRARKPRMAGN